MGRHGREEAAGAQAQEGKDPAGSGGAEGLAGRIQQGGAVQQIEQVSRAEQQGRQRSSPKSAEAGQEAQEDPPEDQLLQGCRSQQNQGLAGGFAPGGIQAQAKPGVDANKENQWKIPCQLPGWDLRTYQTKLNEVFFHSSSLCSFSSSCGG